MTNEYWRNELNQNSMSGSELMMTELEKKVDPELLKDFHFTLSRARELPNDKIRIFWAHDLPNDPESISALSGGMWQRFHKIVFVTNWQQQLFIEQFGIPWSRTIVMRNAIDDVEIDLDKKFSERKGKPVRLIYHTTPHRGLNILVPVCERLVQEGHDNFHLDVYSSFKLYGWEQNDEPFQELFKKIKDHPNMSYHGSVSNDEIRTALSNADIFAFPSIWTETSCRSLIEAMAFGNLCVHPNFGALPETAGHWTFMYPYHEDPNSHASQFYDSLRMAMDITTENAESLQLKLKSQKAFADFTYSWQMRAREWEVLLKSLKSQITEEHLPIPEKITPTGKTKIFRYEVNI